MSVNPLGYGTFRRYEFMMNLIEDTLTCSIKILCSWEKQEVEGIHLEY